MHAQRAEDEGHANLTIIDGRLAGRRVVFGEIALLGRADDATLSVDDAAVSRNHARIERQPDGGYVLVDLASTNGTFVNGRRARRELLFPGDHIVLGRAVTCFSPATTRGGSGSFDSSASRCSAPSPTACSMISTTYTAR